MHTFNYDKRFDILNIGIGSAENRKNSIGAEEYNRLVVMRDRATREATGLMIYDFKKRLDRNELPVVPNDVPICLDGLLAHIGLG